ncbi:LacI family transcriptional regulator [Tissierella sp. MSJ-40]|uniref:LacI family transcriptional regulator n=1 Tax=Tissierella simiarum TaxID=2841534 RepID=A0ABS6E1W6_9FIRM|nr:LacI family DNA-binding transcriptional regulator [Tissierella simiarum]MBU5436789.1 LacI family transcriptional regulator [Tissierella simiarum]
MTRVKRPTIYDIANTANVSPATVSRVLSGANYPISDDTKKLVLDVAEELEYRPSSSKYVTKSRLSEIGVIVPNLSNPYYSTLVLAVERFAAENKMRVLLCNSNGDENLEKYYVESLIQKKIKGIIISSVASSVDHINNIRYTGASVVSFDQIVDIDCNKVSFDYREGGYLATKHLIDLGHRRIAFISPYLTRHSRKKIFEGYKDCLVSHNIKVEESLIFTFPELVEKSENTGLDHTDNEYYTKELLRLKDRPTAIFCINDVIALKVLKELKFHGIKVPEEVSIVGFDNIDILEVISPRLTTVDQCTYEMGRLAAEMLYLSVMDKTRKNISVSLQPVLVKGESTAPINTPIK